MIQPSLLSALYDREISPRDFQILFYLVVAELDPVEFHELKALAVARALDVSHDTVERTLLNLTRAGYLECQPRTGPGELPLYRYVHRVAKMRVPKAS